MISYANIKLGLYRIALDMTLKITDLCILKNRTVLYTILLYVNSKHTDTGFFVNKIQLITKKKSIHTFNKNNSSSRKAAATVTFW